MFGFFDQMIGVVETVFTVLVNVLSSLVTAFSVLLTFMNLPLTVGSYLPAFLLSGFTVYLSIAVIKFLVNR